MQPEQVILISSIPEAAHLPKYFRLAGKWNMDQAIPVSAIKKGIIAKRLVSPQGREDSDIIRDIVEKSDARFIRWAMRAILEWDGRMPETHVHHIHGTRDIVLPLRYTRPTHLVKGAGHLMVMDRAEEINKLLAEIFPSVSFP
jgi:pimeloyl-ACP methyl ester carboxylesterase